MNKLADDAVVEKAKPEPFTSLTLRDYFAANALAGMLANSETVKSISDQCSGNGFGDAMVREAYRFARGMLAERER